MWIYLKENFYIEANDSCGTHVHISLSEGYTLKNLKSVAQTIIHFEPSLEALLPENRRGNEYSRSNWIDNPNFAYKKLSRAQSIDVIEQCSTIREVVLLMNPNHDKMFGWNFLYLLSDPKGTIEFRRGAASTTVTDVFMWVELAMSFIQAAIRIGVPENLQKIPRTVGGLQWFIKKADLGDSVTGMFESRHLDRLFAGKGPDATLSPKPLGELSPEKKKKLLKKKEEDKRKNVIQSKMLQPPFWG
jgi:Putative amidoligase enzyme